MSRRVVTRGTSWVRVGAGAMVAGALIAAALSVGGAAASPAPTLPDPPHGNVVVQAAGDIDDARDAVEAAGGKVGEALPLVTGFSARLTESAAARLATEPAIRAVTADGSISFEALTYDTATA